MTTNDADVRTVLAAALEVCASVSKPNLARRGESLHSTLVDPFAVRRLAEALELLLPGAVDRVRTVRKQALETAYDMTQQDRRPSVSDDDDPRGPGYWGAYRDGAPAVWCDDVLRMTRRLADGRCEACGATNHRKTRVGSKGLLV